MKLENLEEWIKCQNHDLKLEICRNAQYVEKLTKCQGNGRYMEKLNET
jgi:hypothetical protein